MANNMSLGEKVFQVFNTLLMLALMFVTLYPFMYILFASVSNPSELVTHRGLLFTPLGLKFDAYRYVLENPNIMNGYKNTLFYVVFGTSLNVLLTSFGAYVLSRKNLYWKKIIMFMVVFSMFFEGGLIPFYLLVRSLKLTNTVWALILPIAMQSWNLIIMRTYFMSIPDAMEESAKIDGANDFVILFRVILPLAIPVVAVIALFYGVWHWNSWFYAMVFLRDRELFPLQLILREIIIASSTDSMITSAAVTDKAPISETVKHATIIVTTLPILFVYPFLQKYFVKGIMVGALKW